MDLKKERNAAMRQAYAFARAGNAQWAQHYINHANSFLAVHPQQLAYANKLLREARAQAETMRDHKRKLRTALYWTWHTDPNRQHTNGKADQYARVFIGAWVFMYYRYYDGHATFHVIKSATRDFEFSNSGTWCETMCENAAIDWIVGDTNKL